MTESEKILLDIYLCLMKKYGVDCADRDIYPVSWYINTGRATLTFIRLLKNAKTFMICNRLHKGGSVDETLQRIFKLIGYEPNCI